MSVIEKVPTTVAPERRGLMGSAYDLSGATTANEARSLADLDWEAVHRPLYVDIPPKGDETVGDLTLVTKERAVVRTDTGEMFGVVGKEHKILSNRDLFDFADTLLDQADLTWANANPFGGARSNGAAPFLAFQLGEGIQVAGVDAVDVAILLNNGHVGNTAFTLTVTPIRLKCSNVVRAAITSGRKGHALYHQSIQHSGDLDTKVGAARAALELTTVYMREFADLANRMAETEFGISEFDDFITSLVPISEDAGARAKATAEERRSSFRRNWKDTLTLDLDLRNTAWGALNVVTEVIDHGSLDVRKSSAPVSERRLNSVHFGSGARLRDRAFHLLAGV